jgi:hypothetical protein
MRSSNRRAAAAGGSRPGRLGLPHPARARLVSGLSPNPSPSPSPRSTSARWASPNMRQLTAALSLARRSRRSQFTARLDRSDVLLKPCGVRGSLDSWWAWVLRRRPPQQVLFEPWNVIVPLPPRPRRSATRSQVARGEGRVAAQLRA